MAAYLETERVSLRQFTPDDAGILFDLDNDPGVAGVIGGPTPREVIEREILPAFLAYHDQGASYGFWVAQDRGSRDFIGWFHLRPQPDEYPEDPELGYRMLERYWGRGIATEVSRALIAKAFTELGARRVWARTAADHRPSWRVMEKAGMKLQRRWWNERWSCEDVDYQITVDDWKAGRV